MELNLEDDFLNLIDAIQTKNIPRFISLINEGVDIEFEDEDGNTPLFYAVQKNNPEMIQVLINNGADINHENHQGLTPLFESLDPELSLFLIRNGSDVNHSDINGLTPLFYLSTDPYQQNPALLEIARILIQNGADVNAMNENGRTPLFRAVQDNDLPRAQLLIQNGAEVNHQDIYGETPLFLVKSYDMVQLLLENKADIFIENNQDQTALDRDPQLKELILNRYPEQIPYGLTLWQYYCQQFNELNLLQLRNLAKEAGITQAYRMRKPELCQALANSYLEFTATDNLEIKNNINCEQNDGRTLELEDFDKINPYLIIRDNKGFCHYLPELERILSGSNRHPFTREDLDQVYVGEKSIREVAKERRKLVKLHQRY